VNLKELEKCDRLRRISSTSHSEREPKKVSPFLLFFCRYNLLFHICIFITCVFLLFQNLLF